jgi:hypothetical protein
VSSFSFVAIDVFHPYLLAAAFATRNTELKAPGSGYHIGFLQGSIFANRRRTGALGPNRRAGA